MIVNTEWGAFDNERVVLPITLYDNQVDRLTINPRKQAFEKMIGGLYLGEVTRCVLLDLVDRGILFSGYSSPALNTHYGFDTELMSLIEAHGLPINPSVTDTISIRDVLVTKLGLDIKHVSNEDSIIVYQVSQIVGTRGARLSACALAAVVKQTGHDAEDGTEEIHMGVDGSVVQFYPGFETRVRPALRELLGEKVEQRVKIGLAKDGSGVGAALCALASKQQREAQ